MVKITCLTSRENHSFALANLNKPDKIRIKSTGKTFEQTYSRPNNIYVKVIKKRKVFLNCLL